jgi:endonuclease/exonuclease/phosphatase family metal-dependent hydrolase
MPDLQGLAHFIGKEISPDVIGMQEVDYRQPRSGGSEQIAELARLLGNWHWGFVATVHGTPGEKWRRHTKDEQQHYFSHDGGAQTNEPQYGIGLISKVDVKHWHVLELGRSRIGMPLLVPAENPKTGKPRVRFIYVKDEPRVALAAELTNGLTVAVTHLSFVPLVNLWQLWRAKRWISRLPGSHVLLGDFNIPIPGLIGSKKWRSLHASKSYPSWGAKVKFDYIITDGANAQEIAELPHSGFSDHLPLVVELIS